MRALIETYSYNPVAKTVTMSFTETLVLEQVLLITNVTRNKIIYNFANAGGTISNNILTFTADTTGHNAADRLMIYVDDGRYPVSESSIQELQSQTIMLRRLIKVLESNTVMDAQQRQKITVDSISPSLTLGTVTTVGVVNTVTTVSTVTAVTSLTSFGTSARLPSLNSLDSVPTFENQVQWSRTAYGTAIRPQLNFS